jgi:hypothetical protein
MLNKEQQHHECSRKVFDQVALKMNEHKSNNVEEEEQWR